jgi:salicylate hydroxylase
VNPSLPTYYQDRLCLLGDAAHATTPHLGSGAGMALEDAYILSNLLGGCKKTSKSSLTAAFIAYDAIRRPRTQKVIRVSRAQGLVLDLEGPETGEDLAAVAASLDEKVRFVWGVDLVGELEKANGIFEGLVA